MMYHLEIISANDYFTIIKLMYRNYLESISEDVLTKQFLVSSRKFSSNWNEDGLTFQKAIFMLLSITESFYENLFIKFLVLFLRFHNRFLHRIIISIAVCRGERIRLHPRPSVVTCQWR